MKGRDPLIMREAIQSNQSSAMGDQSNIKGRDPLIMREAIQSNQTSVKGD